MTSTARWARRVANAFGSLLNGLSPAMEFTTLVQRETTVLIRTPSVWSAHANNMAQQESYLRRTLEPDAGPCSSARS
jgi:hypothetical protein